MTDKMKKWLIRRSEGVKKVKKCETVLLIILTITFIIGVIANNDFCLTISFFGFLLLAVLLRLIVAFLETINRNKDKILQNNIIYVLLSGAEFVQDYLHYLVNWPIALFSLFLYSNIPEEKHFMAILLLLILVISLVILEIKLSEKISSIFKEKLS